MSSNSTLPQQKNEAKESLSPENRSTALSIDKAQAKSTQTQQQARLERTSDYKISRDTSSQASQAATMSSTASSQSPASSTRAGSSIDTIKRQEPSDHHKSSVERAMEKAKTKLGRRPSGAEALPNDESDFQRQHAKAVEKQKRKEEYERLGLSQKTKFGMPGGGGSFNSI